MPAALFKRSPIRNPLGIFLIALSLLGASSLAMKEYRLALFGERSNGIVRKVETITSSSGSKWINRNGRRVAVSQSSELTFMSIEFSTQLGRTLVVETLATFHTSAKVGDVHPMIYLANHPENAKIYSARQLWLPMGIGTLFTLLCGFGGTKLLQRGPLVRSKSSIAP